MPRRPSDAFSLRETIPDYSPLISHPPASQVHSMPRPRWAEQPQTRTSVFNKALAVINILLSLILALSLALVANDTNERCNRVVYKPISYCIVSPYPLP